MLETYPDKGLNCSAMQELITTKLARVRNLNFEQVMAEIVLLEIMSSRRTRCFAGLGRLTSGLGGIVSSDCPSSQFMSIVTFSSHRNRKEPHANRGGHQGSVSLSNPSSTPSSSWREGRSSSIDCRRNPALLALGTMNSDHPLPHCLAIQKTDSQSHHCFHCLRCTMSNLMIVLFLHAACGSSACIAQVSLLRHQCGHRLTSICCGITEKSPSYGYGHVT